MMFNVFLRAGSEYHDDRFSSHLQSDAEQVEAADED